MKIFIALLVTFVALVFYLFYIPLPKGIEEPWKLRMINFYQISLYPLVEIGSLLGINTKINITRRLRHIFESRFLHYSDPDVKVVWSNMAGVSVLWQEPIDTSPTPRPAILYFHGGGFVFYNPENFLKITIPLAKDLNAVVISVNYRKAPEHPYPASFDDCLTATLYLFKNFHQFNIDPTRIVLAGDSAGGNLAAAVALKLRTTVGIPPIKSQVLVYPALQILDLRLPSFMSNDKVPILSRKHVAFYSLLYMNENIDLIPVLLANNHTSSSLKNSDFAMYVNPQNLPKKYLQNYIQAEPNFGDFKLSERLEYKLLDPLMFPLMERNLNNLPPTLVVTCEYDVLRDDGFLYAYRLRQAGIPVVHENIKGGFHGAWSLKGLMGVSEEMYTVVVDYLKKNL